jgi:Spy/CpxP family protein refolding chaperone
VSSDLPTGTNPAAASLAQPKRRMPIWTGAVIFVCGVLVGVAATFIGLDRMMAQRFRHPEKMVERMVDDLSVKLDLTAEQRTQVTAIFEQNRDSMDRLFREEIRPKIDAEFNALKENVAAVLTAEQAAKWNEDFEHMRKRFGPPRPPSGEPPDKH